MKKKPEITDRTRQNLVDAFWTLYTTQRIDRITVREITNLAGYNRSTFYEYFRDVYAVLEYIENQSLPTLEELPPLIDKDQRSQVLIDSVLDLYRSKFKYYGVLLGENGDPAFQRKLKDSLKLTVMQAISSKVVVDKVEIDLLLEFVLSGIIGILIYWFHRKPDISEDRLIEIMYDVMQADLTSKLQLLMVS
jgi:AcrR family transcriptional regulator